MILFENLLDQFKPSWPELDIKYRKQCGSVFGLFYLTKPVLHIADPELIKQVLVKDFNKFINRRELNTEHRIIYRILFLSRDERWKVSRSISTSRFSSGKMKKLYGLVRNCLQGCLENCGELAEKGIHFESKSLNLTLDANCIGMRFAVMEVKLAMAHIILRYRFMRCDKTEDKIKFKQMTPILSPMNITIGIEKR